MKKKESKKSVLDEDEKEQLLIAGAVATGVMFVAGVFGFVAKIGSHLADLLIGDDDK